MAAVLDDGSRVFADACVLAVPHDLVLALLPGDMSGHGAALESLRKIKTSPITGVHLWFDRPVMTEPFLTLLDHKTQWIFNKSLLSANVETNGQLPRPITRASLSAATENEDGQYLQLVISASYDLVPRSRQEIIDFCMRDLADVLPAAREARLLKATVIKEVNATFSPEPGRGPMAPRPGNRDSESLSCGRLDTDGLACHNGRSGAQRVSRCRILAHRFWSTPKVSAPRFAVRRFLQIVGRSPGFRVCPASFGTDPQPEKFQSLSQGFGTNPEPQIEVLCPTLTKESHA